MNNYYRVCAEIDLDAALKNAEALKNKNPDTEIAAVIKADGYGHGAVPIANTIYDIVSAFAVATSGEAMNLRRHGIDKPIHILGYTHSDTFMDMINNDIRMTVFDYETAKEISDVAVRLGKQAMIHIALDTGMGRIGYRCTDKDVCEIINISSLPNITIEGIFTHFATADEKDKTFAYEQLGKYNDFVNRLEDKGLNIKIKHCANSAAIMEIPEANFTESRMGIALYGLYPSEEVDKSSVELKPVMSLKSHVIYVKTVPAGTRVSYGSTYITERETKIATIPVGYGDGYPRNLSNKGYVLINGHKVSIIGRVCMDQFMVDVTDIKDVKRGDEVILVGSDGSNSISVEELSELAGTFNYEFVCGIGKRIPRIYYRNGMTICKKDYFDDEYNIVGSCR